MKKKLLTVFSVAVCLIICVFAVCVCSSCNKKHKHDYGTEWQTNAAQHWHECKNDGCEEKVIDKADHADNDGDVRCDVCQYDMTVEVKSAALNKAAFTLGVGDKGTLSVYYAPTNTTEKTIIWSSSEPSIASVDDRGEVTASAVGTAIITATAENGEYRYLRTYRKKRYGRIAICRKRR